jgi:hypothetical protein
VLDAAVGAMRLRVLPAGKKLEDIVKQPVAIVMDHHDGLRTCLFMLDGATEEFTVAWKDARGGIAQLAFELQEDRPFSHFGILVNGIEQLMHTGRAPWPVERTLLTSGLVDEALRSLQDGGRLRETPHLQIAYQSDWNWTQPLAPAPARPAGAQ